MGADFIYGVLPSCDVTDERRKELEDTINGFTEFEGMAEDRFETIDEMKESMLAAVETYDNSENRRDCSLLHLPDMTYNAVITGGMSWGDNPTEAEDDFNILADSSTVWALLEKWAKEDWAKWNG